MRYRHGVLALLFSLSIITYIDRVCISVAGPRMQQDLAIPPDLWGWVVGAFAFSYAAFEIPTEPSTPSAAVGFIPAIWRSCIPTATRK